MRNRFVNAVPSLHHEHDSYKWWVLGNVMNNPSEGQERPGANSLVVVRKHSVRPPPVQVQR